MSQLKDAKDLHSGQGLPNQEAVLLDYIERLKKFRQGRRALHLQLGRLRPQNQQPHHLQIAQQAFESLIQAYEGALFKIFNNDLVVTFRGAPKPRIDETLQPLRELFAADPLLGGPAAEAEFATHYDMEQDFEGLIALCHRLARARREHDVHQAAESRLDGILPESGTEAEAALDPEGLQQMVSAIVQADLSSFSRRQAICALTPGEKPQPLIREVYISIADLGEMLLPGREILANRWLFQYLTQILDQRVLAMLAAGQGILREGHISLNLNVQSATSTDFLELDAALNREDRKKVLVELQLIDAYADLARFAFTRDFLRSKGYRICLDGCSHLALPHIDRQRLGVDFVKMAWSDELADHPEGPQLEDLRQAIARMGAQRVILNRCDAAAALEIGQRLGIHLYQGYFLDALLEEDDLRHKPVDVLTENASAEAS